MDALLYDGVTEAANSCLGAKLCEGRQRDHRPSLYRQSSRKGRSEAARLLTQVSLCTRGVPCTWSIALRSCRTLAARRWGRVPAAQPQEDPHEGLHAADSHGVVGFAGQLDASHPSAGIQRDRVERRSAGSTLPCEWALRRPPQTQVSKSIAPRTQPNPDDSPGELAGLPGQLRPCNDHEF